MRPIADIDFADSLVVVAFPTTGSVASIAGHYLQQKLTLPLVGSFVSDPHGPVAAVREGIATSPIRVFGGEVECELPEGNCPRLYIILADLPLAPQHFGAVSAAILQATAGCRLVLCLDAVVRDEGDDIPDVYSVAVEKDVLADLALKEVEPLPDAFIGGMTGQLLLDSAKADSRVGALIVEAAMTMPDGRAAANLLKAVDQLLPLVPVDADPLLAEALALEEEIRKAQKAAARQVPADPVDFDSFI